jgi:hypothetical protein
MEGNSPHSATFFDTREKRVAVLQRLYALTVAPNSHEQQQEMATCQEANVRARLMLKRGIGQLEIEPHHKHLMVTMP